MQIKELIKDYFAILKHEEIDSLFSILKKNAIMSTPFDGILKGHESIKDFIIIQREWLLDQNAKLDILQIINSDNRLIFEFILVISADNISMNLPFCVALDIKDSMVHSIRLYYNTKPLTGKHFGIKPILKTSQIQNLPDIIYEFFNAIQHKDKDKILSLFENDGYIRESMGTQYKLKGELNIRDFISFINNNNGISIKPCSITTDGSIIAVEHRFKKLTQEIFDDQAGIFIFKLGKNGKIAELRCYDDVSFFHK